MASRLFLCRCWTNRVHGRRQMTFRFGLLNVDWIWMSVSWPIWAGRMLRLTDMTRSAIGSLNFRGCQSGPILVQYEVLSTCSKTKKRVASGNMDEGNVLAPCHV